LIKRRKVSPFDSTQNNSEDHSTAWAQGIPEIFPWGEATEA